MTRAFGLWRAASSPVLSLLGALALAGCAGPQSALDPAGEGAARLATLFWVMLAGAAVLWVLVLALAAYAARSGRHGEGVSASLILWGGAVLPAFVLVALLAYGLMLMPDLRGPGDGLRVTVTGEQYWWRVRYAPAGGGPEVESANEVRLPAGRRVEFHLQSADVIHSFWIPALGGKLDMIPGRVNRLVLHPTRPGIYRGACAEFCGRSHALMAFSVVVMEAEEFSRWLAAEAGEAAPSSEARGAELFLAQGCGACHAVRGSEAAGTIGPDLTRIGGRQTIGAGLLDNSAANLARFITETERIKPGARMPSFAMLTDEEADAIAAYLRGLQ